MFNRIARFALCLALLSLSACAGAGRQAHGTAQRQDPLLGELAVIVAVADAAGRGGDSDYDDDDDGGSGGAMVAVVGAAAIAAGIAYLVFSDSGDVDGVKAPRQRFKSTNNVSATPAFIQAAQRSAL